MRDGQIKLMGGVDWVAGYVTRWLAYINQVQRIATWMIENNMLLLRQIINQDL